MTSHIRWRVAAVFTATMALLSPVAPAFAAPPGPPQPAAASSSAAPTSTVPTTPEEALAMSRAQQAFLQKAADETTAKLTDATQAADRAATELAATRAQAAQSRAAAAAARVSADAAQARVDAFASAQYRNPTPAGLSVVLTDQSDAASVLQGLGYLQVVGQSEATVVTEARRTRLAAQRAQADADRAESDATTLATTLTADLDAARTQAAGAAKALTAGLGQVEAAQQIVAAFAAAGQSGASAALCLDNGQVLVPPTSTTGAGFPNGLIPASNLCPIRPGQRLRADASIAFHRLDAAYTRYFGTPICLTDSYRDYAAQVDLFARKPTMAAVPGTSNHGWGLAIDFCGGIEAFGTPQYQWMVAHAGEFGWFHPTWADAGSARAEPWHWEFGHIS